MNGRKQAVLVAVLAGALRLAAQLPDGATPPNFTAQDINGLTHNLYQTLDSGKIVILDINATWCPPCWVYHNSHALQDLYEIHGPSGDDRLRIFWVEGDPNTTVNCLYGAAGCSAGSMGNYVTGTPYPIFDNTAIANAYQTHYFPTLYVICPNRRLYEVGPAPPDDIWNTAKLCPVESGVNNAGIFQYSPGTQLSELCGAQELKPKFALTNLGSAPLTAATVELHWNNQLLQTLQWTGNLPTYGEALVSFDSHLLDTIGALKTTVIDINNGAADADLSNNTRSDLFSKAQQFNNTSVLLKLRTDSYGEETYWELRDDAGAVLESGGNTLVGPNGGGQFPLGTPIGPGAYPSLTIVRDTITLPAEGCYSIHISDGYGDGMCCDFGSGYFRLYNLDAPNTPLISGGEFHEYSRRAFGVSVPTATQDLASPEIDLELFPNPATEFLNASFQIPEAMEIRANVFNAFGQLWYEHTSEKADLGDLDWRIPVADWPVGVYFLQIKTNKGHQLTRPFVVR